MSCQVWIGWHTYYPSITAEWVGRGCRSTRGRDWAATLVHVGGAEVIHFKGKINDAINPCLGHCSGGQGRIHTCCWLPGTCSMHAWALLRYTRRSKQLLRTKTIFYRGHLICQVSICHEVVMELQGVACVFVAWCYLMDGSFLSYPKNYSFCIAGRRWGEQKREDDRLCELVIDMDMAGTIPIADLCFVLLWLRLNWRGNQAFWHSGATESFLGVSVREWAASTLQLLKDTDRTDGQLKKKKKKRRPTQEHQINTNEEWAETSTRPIRIYWTAWWRARHVLTQKQAKAFLVLYPLKSKDTSKMKLFSKPLIK